ncbi:TetR/AcrR family transcriptional regulator [Geobacter sp. AOG2]|uniref:TetR/AcrR family transcriptional regulator n=1 Tax=Geobacter sp. AOG2 TaxID=1566347 RepID=UPI001CC72412|nr:TetR/AcrR family transcriptional regulator [Geobacter sp. AOG2]GFE62750.1 TetR family transcriptional regulator [Geobacter sp. AOG2]
MTVTKPNKIEITRNHLLEVGLALFSQRGFHGTGIKEIVDQANVPKGSFYTYFKSKEEFGVEIIKGHSIDFWKKWHECFDDTAPDPLEALRNCFITLLEKHEVLSVKTFCAVALIAAEICETSDLCRNATSAIINDMRTNIAVQIDKAQQKGYARTDVDPQDAALFFWDAWQGSIVRMKIENDAAAVTNCLALFFDRLLRA